MLLSPSSEIYSSRLLFDPKAAKSNDPRCLAVVLDDDLIPMDRDFEVRGFATWEPNGRPGGKYNITVNKPDNFPIVNLTWDHVLRFIPKALRRGYATEDEKMANAVFFFPVKKKGEKEEPRIKIRRA